MPQRADEYTGELKRLSTPALQATSVGGPIWGRRLADLHTITLPTQYEQLERTGRLENFRRVARGERGGYTGMFFNDSDVYKWIEAVSLALTGLSSGRGPAAFPDATRRSAGVGPNAEGRVSAVAPGTARRPSVEAPAAGGRTSVEAPAAGGRASIEAPAATRRLESLLGATVELVSAAQQHDGYLNTYFTLMEPVEKRWTNLGMMSELYCAGHLFQAAIAHHRSTGSRMLLETAVRFADLIVSVFGEAEADGRPRSAGRRETGARSETAGAPGHEEIELALVELAEVTGARRYVDLARVFIDRRGTEASNFRRELSMLDKIAGYGFVSPVDNIGTRSVEQFYRDFFLDEDGEYDGSYAQDHVPVREQCTAEGHAVRQSYLGCGVAELARVDGDRSLLEQSLRQWKNMATRRMYITGGIGSTKRVEGFTEDYHLPNETAYAETCAAIGSVMWSHRLARLHPDPGFADVIERTLYNGVLAGLGLDASSYFYMNPLSSDGELQRQPWYHVACCPPNIARLLAALPEYLYFQGDGEIFVNLYAESSADLDLGAGASVRLLQKTDYPWDGTVDISVECAQALDFTLVLRIPAWCANAQVSVNGEWRNGAPAAAESTGQAGHARYLRIHRRWTGGDVVRLHLEMPVERMLAHPAVADDAGRVALARGPIVYCLEQVDHSVPIEEIALPASAPLDVRFDADLLGGCPVIETEAVHIDPEAWGDSLYLGSGRLRERLREKARVPLKAVPYHLWANRDPGEMRVWLRELPAALEREPAARGARERAPGVDVIPTDQTGGGFRRHRDSLNEGGLP